MFFVARQKAVALMGARVRISPPAFMPAFHKTKRRKPAPKFGEDYFQANKKDFNPAFFVKSLRERSGMLAKNHRKAEQVANTLTGVLSYLLRTASNPEPLKKSDLIKLRELDWKTQKIHESFWEDMQKIFSDGYLQRAGFGRGGHAIDEHRKNIHEIARRKNEIRAAMNALWSTKNHQPVRPPSKIRPIDEG